MYDYWHYPINVILFKFIFFYVFSFTHVIFFSFRMLLVFYQYFLLYIACFLSESYLLFVGCYFFIGCTIRILVWLRVRQVKRMDFCWNVLKVKNLRLNNRIDYVIKQFLSDCSIVIFTIHQTHQWERRTSIFSVISHQSLIYHGVLF